MDALLDAANTFPMMAARRVVMVLEAERLLIPKRESKAADEDLARLEAFIQSPSPHATVVFVCGSLDMRRRISKTLAREAQVVDCGTIEDTADAERWIKARAARDKVPLDAAAIRALVDRGGTSLVRLRSGLERVALYAMGQPTISADDVKQSVPAGPDQHQDFGIADAIRQGNAGEAVKQLNAALESGLAPFFLSASCASWPSARPLHAFATRSAPSSGRTSPSSRAAGIKSCCSNGWSWNCAASPGDARECRIGAGAGCSRPAWSA